MSCKAHTQNGSNTDEIQNILCTLRKLFSGENENNYQLPISYEHT